SGAIIHELQKERGLSAGFITTKGAKFKEALDKQRQDTDNRFNDFNQLLATVDASRLGETAMAKLTSSFEQLGQLADKRAAITELRLTGPESFAYYSTTIDQLMDMVTESSKISTLDRTSKALQSLDLFIRAKEFNGRERAAINAAFSSNKEMNPAQFRQISGIVANQLAYGVQFLAVATPQRRSAFETLLASAAAKEVERMRQIAFDKATAGEYGVDAAVWFKTITEKIDALKKIEDDLVGDLDTILGEQRAKIHRDIAVSAAILLIAVVFNVLFVLVMLKLVRGMRETSAAIERIANGDLSSPIPLDRRDELGVVQWSLNQIQSTLKEMDVDAKMLAEAAVAGKLETRASASRHPGEFGRIIQGVNDTLDAVIGPLNVAANYVDRISKGDIPPKITDSYNGDFNTIKNNLNQAIDAISSMVAEAGALEQAAIEGRLATRADAARYQGDYRKIVAGVNNTLDAVIGPLNVAATYVDRISKGDIPPKITDSYNGDFNTIKNNLNTCIDSLNGLIAEMDHMSKEHDAGDIDVKVDEAKFQGAYRAMAQGVNEMVFGHIAVKKLAMGVVKEFGEGNMDAPLQQLPGKKRFINDTIEQVRANIKALVTDANMLSQAAVEGRLETRADASKHKGDFHRIVAGVNNTLDAVIGPLNVAAGYVDRISKGDIPPKITD
ncbi:hypothetical protein RHDC4_01596, partial [Rhodocyclaceae bacterium]